MSSVSSASTTLSTTTGQASANSGTVKIASNSGSGLDIESIVSALVNSQTAGKQEQISTNKTAETNRLSAVNTLTSSLNNFQLTVNELNTTSSFAGLTATTTDDGVASATVDSTAVAGDYSVVVNNLATSSKVATSSISSGTTFASGTLTLNSAGKDYQIDVAQGASISDIRDSINKQSSSTGVTANLITDSSGSRLVLSSTATGANTGITLSGSSGLESLDIDAASNTDSSRKGSVLQQGTDASYTLDGLSMTSASNTIDSAVSGVKFTLAGTGSTTVKVAANTDAVKTSVQSFVDAYNELISSINSLTKVTTTTADDGTSTTEAGALTGDSMTRTLTNQLQNALFSNTGASMSLATLGVTLNKDGTLALDDSVLTTGITNNPNGVQDFFTNSNTGLLSRLDKVVESYTKSSTGVLAQQKTSINNNLTSLSEQQTALDLRTTKLTTTLSDKYYAMDTQVAKLKNTSSSIQTTFDAMNKSDD